MIRQRIYLQDSLPTKKFLFAGPAGSTGRKEMTMEPCSLSRKYSSYRTKGDKWRVANV